MQHFDVAIIGAGPAGSATAIALSRRGYGVALLDKERFPREKLCGDFINPSSWPMLRELGVEREILSRAPQRATGFRITSVTGEEAEAPLAPAAGGPCGLGLSRRALDHLLVKKAEEERVVVLQGARIKSLQRHEEGWELRGVSLGAVETVRARVIVGADGRHSWVAHRLGLTGAAAPQGRAVGFQLRLRCPGGIGERVEIHLFPGGYAGLLGLGGDLINLCLAVDKERLSRDRPLAGLLETRLPLNSHLKKILARSEPASEARATYPVYFPPRRPYGDAVLLVGDAARVSEPVTGEGVSCALESGLLAAEIIDHAFRAGDFSARRLGAYQTACAKAFRLRRGVNALIRTIVYRPALANALIRFLAKRNRFLDSIVHRVCLPDDGR